MPVALLLLVAATDPVVPLTVKPPELPPAMRERLLRLIAEPPALPAVETVISQYGVLDRAAGPLHRRELVRLERWLAVRPDDVSVRRRAWLLALNTDQTAVAAAHSAALGRTLAAAAAYAPTDASRLAELAEWHLVERRQPQAESVARQAVQVDPASADAWRALGVATGWTNWADACRAFDRAAELAPTDWRVPLSRASLRADRMGQDRAAATDLSTCELDLQLAARLGGTDPRAVRWGVLVAEALRRQHSLDPSPAGLRRGLDAARPALVAAAESVPTDARLVFNAVVVETEGIVRLGELAPPTSDATVADSIPPEVRIRHDRWLRRVAAAVAADHDAGAAERAVVAARLFHACRQLDRAVAAAEQAVRLCPCNYCEEALQVALAQAGRADDALDRFRRDPAGRSPAAAARFEAVVLQQAGRWDEARRVAEAGRARFPDDFELAVLAAGCQLHVGDATAVSRLGHVWVPVMAMRPADDPVRLRALRLAVIDHLLAGRYSDAEALLDKCRQNGPPVRDDTELTAAARPYTWPNGDTVRATALDVPVVRPRR